jgi:hypothetical protein
VREIAMSECTSTLVLETNMGTEIQFRCENTDANHYFSHKAHWDAPIVNASHPMIVLWDDRP